MLLVSSNDFQMNMGGIKLVIRKNVKWDVETDVIVLGSGGAALTSAILAHDQGAEVLILEKADQIGGQLLFLEGFHGFRTIAT